MRTIKSWSVVALSVVVCLQGAEALAAMRPSGAAVIRGGGLKRPVLTAERGVQPSGGRGVQLEGSDASRLPSDGPFALPAESGSTATPSGGVCDFSNFSQNAPVGSAYASIGLGFSGANVLNSFNGVASPNPGIVYSPNGRMVVSVSGFNPGFLEFMYSAKVQLTVTSHASTDGTGAAISSDIIAANVASTGGFDAWARFSRGLSPQARSVAISGSAGLWGVDTFKLTTAAPALNMVANASACTTVNSPVVVDARLTGVYTPVVAGQILAEWNPSKLSLVSVTQGDAPFNVVYSLNPSAGRVTVLCSVPPGSQGTSVVDKVVARLNFTVIGGSCTGEGTTVGYFTSGPLKTEFTDGLGSAITPALVGSSAFVVDDGAPVLVGVPANVTTRPEAGGGSTATVTLTPPTATDGCSSVSVSSSRNDGQPLSAPYGLGETTVTWTATDACGNTTSATTRVTVEPYNTMAYTVSYAGSGFAASQVRSLSLTMKGGTTSASRTASATFLSGTANFQVTDLPIDTYTCTTVEDPSRSLRRRVAVTDGGAVWTATASLVLGDIINDEVIDVLDWGAYVVNNPNADLDGNGVINSADGQFILNSFGVQGDGACGSAFDGPPSPREAVSVAELVQMGLAELAGADLNGDGWLDLRDMDMAD